MCIRGRHASRCSVLGARAHEAEVSRACSANHQWLTPHGLSLRHVMRRRQYDMSLFTQYNKQWDAELHGAEDQRKVQNQEGPA